MNRRFSGALVFGLAFALMPAMPAAGQDAAYGPLVLRLPAGARTLAMGNTGIVSRDDEAIFFNPAMLVVANGISAAGERIASGAGVGALSAATRFNGGGIGIGVRYAGFRSPDGSLAATRATILRGGAASGTSLEAVIGIGQTIKGVRVGVAAKVIDELSADERHTVPLIDAGISKDLLGMTVGLAVQNVGMAQTLTAFTPFGGVEQRILLPLRTSLGVGHTRIAGPLDLGVTGAVSLLRTDFVQPSGGVEVGWSWLNGYWLAGRVGARRPAVGESPFTAGAGFTMDRLTIDYAAESLDGGRFGHLIGVRVR